MDRKLAGVSVAYIAAASAAALVLIALLSAALQRGACEAATSAATSSAATSAATEAAGSCSSCSPPPAGPGQGPGQGAGQAKERGAGSRLDPVSDPEYNMVNICKQSVLLEEHLNNEKKRCGDCIKKHFLHIVGLAEEAVSLAGSEAEPLMHEASSTYDRLLREYLGGGDPVKIAQRCREVRKKLMARYVV